MITEMSGLSCIITGSSGSIGSGLSKRFSENGFNVIGIDRVPPTHSYCDHTFLYDINDIVSQASVREEFYGNIRNCSFISGLCLIINCAAFQPLATYGITDVDLYQKALNINTVFPLLLYRLLFDTLCFNNGVLINIGSIHASLTKKGFALYASSKSALRGLTHSLAVENKGKILIYLIEPAAIDTPLLRAGFNEDITKLDELTSHHPCCQIGSPSDISEIAWFLYSKRITFLHGTTIDLSGGIKHVLHDPESL